MNERIKELAKQAGVDGNRGLHELEKFIDLERFAELVRQDEREACAKVCDDLADNQTNQSLLELSDCAEAIRARSKHEL